MGVSIEEFLGGMSLSTFLSDYWGKKPLHIKKALSDPSSFISPTKFLELAQDEMIESRVVQIKNGGYDASHGPFETSFIKDNLDKKGTTWIIHGMNLYDKNFFGLEELARFRPNWNFDDVMLSYSTQGGSVGPHIDSYNVLIVQGRGTKKWLLDTDPDTSASENPNLRLLKNFDAKIEWTLEEGDMIYIPPHVAHHGITESEEGMSYSIGFKSFKGGEIYPGYFAHAMNHLGPDKVFEPKAVPLKDDSIFELSEETIDDLYKDFTENYLTRDLFKGWLGGYLTSPRVAPEKADDLSLEEFIKELGSRPFYKDEHLRILFSGEKLYVGEKELALEDGDRELFEMIAKKPSWEEISFDYQLADTLKQRLYDLYCAGFFFFTEA